MIVPTKHLRLQSTVLMAGGLVLQALSRPRTISALWELLADRPELGGFQGLLLALDFLYLIGAVDADPDGLLRRVSS